MKTRVLVGILTLSLGSAGARGQDKRPKKPRTGVRVSVEGITEAIPELLWLDPGAATIEYADGKSRVTYAPVEIVFKSEPALDQKLARWLEAARKAGRKAELVGRDIIATTPIRRFVFRDCVATSFEHYGNWHTLHCDVRRIEEQPLQPKKPPRWYRDVVSRTYRAAIAKEPAALAAHKGGRPALERRRAKIPAGNHAQVSDLELKTYITVDDTTFVRMAAAFEKGEVPRPTITLTEVAKDKSVVQTRVYKNCLLTLIAYPRIQPWDRGELMKRKTVWRPGALTVR